MITYQYFKEFGFDHQKLADRLKLCELSDKDKEIAKQFQGMVITPHIERIADEFYEYLMSHKDYRHFIESGEKLAALRKTQTHYLATLGEDFTSSAYFDMRLRVGVAHNRIGMPLVLYETAYRKMREIISAYIPKEIDQTLRNQLRHFCERIISLDMSLAIDSYYQSNVHDMKAKIYRLEDNGRKLQHAAETDPLTHIYNRAGIMSAVYAAIEHARKMGSPLVFLMMDVDSLGDINNRYGHLVGDYLLKEITKRIKSCLPVHTGFGRYGGDEFFIVLPNHTADEAKHLAEKIRNCVREHPFMVGKEAITQTISQGLYCVKGSDELVTIMRHLDTALHEAKQDGGNHIVFN